MRIVLLSIILMVGLGELHAQSTTVNPKLYEKYSEEYLQNLQQNHPDRMAFLNFYVENACYIIDMPSKAIQTETLSKKSGEEIKNTDLDDFNLYLFTIQPLYNSRKFYRAGNTGKLIVVRSQKEVERLYNNHKRSL